MCQRVSEGKWEVVGVRQNERKRGGTREWKNKMNERERGREKEREREGESERLKVRE